jgi:hypothetical protein
MIKKHCAMCKYWQMDLASTDTTGACSKRAIHGGLTDYTFLCEKFKLHWIFYGNVLADKIKSLKYKSK